ncbi:MAG: hypothetical protein LBD46_04760 [Endomicrobium sp.]|jgi:hypothetical protein|nr:hypothetical protein [Endomicrobium sp.]
MADKKLSLYDLLASLGSEDLIPILQSIGNGVYANKNITYAALANLIAGNSAAKDGSNIVAESFITALGALKKDGGNAATDSTGLATLFANLGVTLSTVRLRCERPLTDQGSFYINFLCIKIKAFEAFFLMGKVTDPIGNGRGFAVHLESDEDLTFTDDSKIFPWASCAYSENPNAHMYMQCYPHSSSSFKTVYFKDISTATAKTYQQDTNLFIFGFKQ